MIINAYIAYTYIKEASGRKLWHEKNCHIMHNQKSKRNDYKL